MEGIGSPDVKVGWLDKAIRLVSGWIVLYFELRGDNKYAELMQ
jgi:hypothetical protein